MQTLPADIWFFGDSSPDVKSDFEFLNVKISDSAFRDPRHAAKYYKLCPHCVPELNNYDVTIWVDASCRIKSRYFLELLLMTTNGYICMRRHPDRFSIYSEACYSQKMIKYKGVDLIAQAKSYILGGLVDDRLWHCALIVRYSSPQISLFNSIWWSEMDKSLQDQISTPYAERLSGVRIEPIPKYLNWFNIYSFDIDHRNHEYEHVTDY